MEKLQPPVRGTEQALSNGATRLGPLKFQAAHRFGAGYLGRWQMQLGSSERCAFSNVGRMEECQSEHLHVRFAGGTRRRLAMTHLHNDQTCLSNKHPLVAHARFLRD
jgi:hypothetical protein